MQEAGFSVLCAEIIRLSPFHLFVPHVNAKRSQWLHGLKHASAAACLIGLQVRIPPGAWQSVCCDCCVLWGRVLCDGSMTRPGDSYRLCRVLNECAPKTSIFRRPRPTRTIEPWQKINACNSDIKELVISVLGAGCAVQFSVTHALPVVALSSLKCLYISAEIY
jgi:hypothetical protein